MHCVHIYFKNMFYLLNLNNQALTLNEHPRVNLAFPPVG
jgi:hypothetical protein